MPDWSYRTIFRPLLFRLDPVRARDITVRWFGLLSHVPLGPQLIDLLGHPGEDRARSRSLAGIRLRNPIGLGAGIDLDGAALRAWEGIGFGFVEVGPVASQSTRGVVERSAGDQSIRYVKEPRTTAAAVARRLPKSRGVTVAARLSDPSPQDVLRAIQVLDPIVDIFTVDEPRVIAAVHGATARPLFAVVRPDIPADVAIQVARQAIADGATGLLIAGGIASGSDRLVGRAAAVSSATLLQVLRAALPGTPIIASGGVIEPADGLALFDAGASAITLHSGLVFSGPALPRRIETALRVAEPARAREEFSFATSWTWLLLIGVGLILGGLAEALIASTTVVLPYDEGFLGLARAGLDNLAPHLLDFMRHDRLTLGGATIAVGVLYVGFSLFAVRRGVAWARTALLASGVASTAGSLVLPFVYGYPDPLHLAVIAVLIPLFIGAAVGRFAVAELPSRDTRNDRAWSLGLWGQLCFVAVGAGLVSAGAVISVLGATAIFVPEDLVYLGTTAEKLSALNTHLLPVVAHDRSNFGATLVAAGLPVLLSALWGYTRGATWLWWALAIAGAIGFATAFGVHAAVGYIDFGHLTPAYIGLVIYVVGLACSRAYLCEPSKRSISQVSRLPWRSGAPGATGR